MRRRTSLAALAAVSACLASGFARADEARVALVVGESAYPARALNTAANDAGLVAQALQDAGFQVMGARDLDRKGLADATQDFLDAVAQGGPDTVAFVYFAGYGLQYRGANYLAPVDATIARQSDAASQALDVSGLVKALAAAQIKSGTVVLDAAHAGPFQTAGHPAAGLGIEDVQGHMVVAFNAAPGTVAPDWQASYGPYATALVQTLREGGLALPDMFVRVRMRTEAASNGAQTPWCASGNAARETLLARSPGAPAVVDPRFAAAVASPMSSLAPSDAFDVALARDTLGGYESFLEAYADDPLASRVETLAAARRESLTWRSAALADTPDAYWSYLRRYPEGPHSGDAEQRLAELMQPSLPPPGFADSDLDVPPPTAAELAVVGRNPLWMWDPSLQLAPPPPIPAWVSPYGDPSFLQPPVDYGSTYLPIVALVALPEIIVWPHRHRGDAKAVVAVSLPPTLSARTPVPRPTATTAEHTMGAARSPSDRSGADAAHRLPNVDLPHPAPAPQRFSVQPPAATAAPERAPPPAPRLAPVSLLPAESARSEPAEPSASGPQEHVRPRAEPSQAAPAYAPSRAEQRPYVAPQTERPYVAPQEQRRYVAPQTERPYVAPQEQRPYVAPQEQRPYVAPQEQRPYVAPQTEQRRYVAPQEQRQSAPERAAPQPQRQPSGSEQRRQDGKNEHN